jgi:hypothetical protein
MIININLSTTSQGKLSKRKLYKDEFGYYIKRDGGFQTTFQKNGKWVIDTLGMNYIDYCKRVRNHTEKNAIKLIYSI